MRRAYILLLIGIGVVVFLAVSAVLARVFSIDAAERSAITSLVAAEARGDAGAMIDRIEGCSVSASCRAGVGRDAAALKRPGSLSVLELNTSAGFSLGSTVGIARIAWRTRSGLPTVQCIRVRRAGNAFTGLRVELLALSGKIESDSVCPTSF